ncbi:ATP-dependent DNA helicase RecG [Actinorhabdospora filicis]|uniref:Probable DNA 3'-5' helicase RecG n=1 Tax=Actinorhabdospora filicis TaxID=1785913 RepID=A0A9W6SPP3_9ACTN|nr:ATP-dependent DNA helicase RecG [Actinorhabdospora filicis]GLZ79921.1 ATP-dependent DNA helicase RecG [Actinorhabdospora filicis]
MHGLDTALTKVLGGKTAEALEDALDLRTVGDLLRHYPRRYAERGERTDLATLEIGEQVTIMAEIRAVNRKQMRTKRGSMLEVLVGDGDRTISLTFFNQAWRERELQPGKWGLFAGKVSEFRGRRQLNAPDYRMLPDPDSPEGAEVIEEFAGALIPVYPAAAKLPSWTIARCVGIVLKHLVIEGRDPLPADLRAEHKLTDLRTALHDVHRPGSKGELYNAIKRLKWEEAFGLQVVLVRRKHSASAVAATPRPPRADGILAAFDAALPFELTEGQREVGETIAADLATPHPMHRLLQGEVGSGKTMVSMRAMLQVVDSGAQAALLAPTEVLATQHHRTITDMLGDRARAGELDAPAEATRVALVTGSQGAKARKAALAEVADGTAGIVVGTHALLYDSVDFRDLGLVVVDEQHRFGVEQRDALRAKAAVPPHVLVMTATPIPRTVAMTVYGDLEVSSLAQLPKGRSPITTHVVPGGDERWMRRTWQRLREEVQAGHQAYIVCPRIGDDDKEPGDDGRRPPLAVLDVGPALAEGALHGLRVGILHGRLPPEEKDAVMRAFKNRELDVIVATTVIEVGVDVPNATMMVILDADRFGVSQLHQLRGRVGRGSAAGLCLLVSEAYAGGTSAERLAAVAETTDGFRLAELDLEQRREGDVLGEAQSGHRSQVKLLSLLKDADLIREAREAAMALVAADPELERHPELAATVAALVDDERAEYLEKG